MAKKRSDDLTPEERLEQALVPDWEQPYKVPGNWCWVNFSEISNIQTGKRDANYGNKNGQYYFFTCASKPLRCDNYSFDCEALLLAGNGDINNISLFKGKFEAYQRTYVVKPSDIFPIEYFYYYFKYRWFDYNKDKMYGTAIPYIRLGNLQEFPIPIAPLAEQQRIVERIESLFAKLDEAKEKTQAALDSFETRKTAMLHNAFTGELTAKWRSEHSVSIENWGEKRLQNICHKITCGHTPTLDITECGEIPFLKVYNIVNNLVDFEYKPQYISRNIHNHNLSSSILYPGDVIMNIVGPPLRKIAIVPNTYPEWNMNQAIVRFRPKNELDNRFLYYSLLFPKTLDNVISKTKGVVGQANISITQSRNISIPVPTFAEQKEIVRILDDFFAKEQKAKELCSVLDNIDLIKKFILSRIFKGELGTNDPTEESAKELLMECLIQQTKENQEKKTKKTILIPIPKKVKAQLSNQIEHDIYSLLQKEGSCDLKKITAVRKNDLLVIDSVRTMAEKGIIKKQIDGCYCISELR